ncbi:Bug family tripartite tricarboxylate transporter substrate binding protein [Hydrogenophaga sp. BPS33]|uniref:Bug family tripartite tricarboxylate transporter substrate binding protein n=1 Tax=Hydrogenophaga sp. BPS33 TaxID=2651974 RepID=UPI00131FE6E1|nr:tripartite tricarboxylate transporter substrate binding protein [Hydrogenophaga sp. BPS33]QHE83694.1 tripartite tricarboxylate transporter substrate binding protein [Hydrogenophaga sp. BPS33]
MAVASATSWKRRLLATLLGGLLLGAVLTAVQAQTYPAKAIRLVVPYPPGGTTDVVARHVATQLSERLGQPVVVDAKPGGNTLIGGQIVAGAAPDGYTLLFIGGSSMTSVYNKHVPFDLWTALTPVAPLYQGAYFLMTSRQLPVSTIGEFLAHARAHPGKLNYGASGPGTMLAMEALKTAAGLDIKEIPYKGSSPVTLALLSNEIQVVLDAIVTYRPHLQADKLKIIGSGGRARSADFAQVPTLAETGFPGFQTVFNGGVWAPAGTPRAIVERLNRELVAISGTSGFRDVVRQAGAEPLSGSPEDFGQIIRSEVEFWTRAAKAANYQPQ